MIGLDLILATFLKQSKEIENSDKKLSVRRTSVEIPSALNEFARIITGIRRSGKSTFVNQDFFKTDRNAFYLNFDDPALYSFSASDFAILEEAIERFQNENKGSKAVYFDEIQVVEGWEVFVNSQLRKGNLVTVTGSNASLLSYELGTRLTGRHLDYELFPFNFDEYCKLRKCDKTSESFKHFLEEGGFPEYLIYNRTDILKRLFEDILMRDVIVRYGIKDVRSVKMLSVYLASNCGNLITGSKLSAQLGLKTTATILEYLSFLEQCYLFFFVPKFNYSAKAQSVNPKKVYCIDTGMIQNVTLSINADMGRVFENAVFIELRRRTKNIWYYSEAAFECDFLYGRNVVPENAVQVCYELTSENKEREVRGLVETCKKFPGVKPLIVTFNQNDKISYGGMIVEAVPAVEFFR
ncbi:ATP-binding protein [Treponema berlinense]|uniref:ATP-binding protein n=1 Tax=Treponema berlinense TaxID=225004 RepID=UPI0026EBE17F|nr:ATP-binding protein [Treponema berlinense]